MDDDLWPLMFLVLYSWWWDGAFEWCDASVQSPALSSRMCLVLSVTYSTKVYYLDVGDLGTGL